MKFCRINLAKTNYHPVDNFKIINNPDFEQLNRIYYDYCHYHGFQSVQPIFPEDLENTVFGYYDKQELVAFTICVDYAQGNNQLNMLTSVLRLVIYAYVCIHAYMQEKEKKKKEKKRT